MKKYVIYHLLNYNKQDEDILIRGSCFETNSAVFKEYGKLIPENHKMPFGCKNFNLQRWKYEEIGNGIQPNYILHKKNLTFQLNKAFNK